MANSYTITSMVNTGSPASDPAVVITGTVNGIPVQIQVWNSVLQQHLATAVAFETFIAPLLLAAAPAASTTIAPPASSFSL